MLTENDTYWCRPVPPTKNSYTVQSNIVCLYITINTIKSILFSCEIHSINLTSRHWFTLSIFTNYKSIVNYHMNIYITAVLIITHRIYHFLNEMDFFYYKLICKGLLHNAHRAHPADLSYVVWGCLDTENWHWGIMLVLATGSLLSLSLLHCDTSVKWPLFGT